MEWLDLNIGFATDCGSIWKVGTSRLGMEGGGDGEREREARHR